MITLLLLTLPQDLFSDPSPLILEKVEDLFINVSIYLSWFCVHLFFEATGKHCLMHIMCVNQYHTGSFKK